MIETTGIFVRELKNRFLCEVMIEGRSEECYIASSCHLRNFIDLAGKEVMLRKVQSPSARTKYAVCGFKEHSVEIPLDMSISNKVIEKEIGRRLMCFLGKRKDIFREYKVDDYKSDIFISDTNTIIEVKSVLTLDRHALFPTVYSERSVKQLKELSNLIDKGYKVCYFLVSLNPKVVDIRLNNDSQEFIDAFGKCVKKGMRYYGISIKTKDGCSSIKRLLPVLVDAERVFPNIV